MKKHLEIPFLSFGSVNDLEQLSSDLGSQIKHEIEYCPWEAFAYRPKAAFVIGYGEDALLLKYFISESSIRAAYAQINDPVYKDTCVEFFIGFDEEDNYYNFEFNCAGTGLLGFGPDRDKRRLLKPDLVRQIRTLATIINQDKSGVNWELTLVIPFEVFGEHKITSLKNRKCKVNFYKCGDELPQPHFLCWNYVRSEVPDFHRPDCFGTARFV